MYKSSGTTSFILFIGLLRKPLPIGRSQIPSLDLNKFKFNKFERGKSNWKTRKMRRKWFGLSTAYTIAKYNMSMYALGLADEFKDEVVVDWIGHKYLFGVQKEKIYLSTFRAKKNYFPTLSLFSKISKNTFLLFHFSRNGKVTFLFAGKVSFLPTPGRIDEFDQMQMYFQSNDY